MRCGRVRTPMPLRGACGLPVQAGLGRSAKPFTRRTNKATSPFTRRTTSAVSAAAARCRGRVRTPMPLRGACGLPVQAGLGRSAKPFTRRINKATSPFTRRTTSAVSAAAARCRGRVRTPMPLRGACGLPVQAGLGQSAKPFTKRTNKATSPFTRRTTSAVSAANECEGITCLWQVTRNGSDEAERSERSPLA